MVRSAEVNLSAANFVSVLITFLFFPHHIHPNHRIGHSGTPRLLCLLLEGCDSCEELAHLRHGHRSRALIEMLLHLATRDILHALIADL